MVFYNKSNGYSASLAKEALSNELVKLVGKQLEIQYEFEKTGEVINGTKLFCAFRDENVEGLRTESFFVKPEIKIPECKINDAIELSFNMKGKIEMIYKA